MTRNLGNFHYQDSDWDRFKRGDGVRLWAAKYPNLFDEKDVSRAINQGGFSKRGRPYNQHFFEWLAAVTLFERFGYLSLYEKYAYRKSHARKWAIVSQLVPSDVLAFLEKTTHGTEAPDLFVYTPDHADWFFCEVKGPSDRLRLQQQEVFDGLAQLTGKPIEIIHFSRARA